MKTCLLIVTLITLHVYCVFLSADVSAYQANADRPGYALDLIKIKLTPEAIALANLPEGLNAERADFGINELDQLMVVNGGIKIIRAHIRVKDIAWEQKTGFDRWFLVKLDGKTSAEKARNSFRASRYIEDAVLECYGYYQTVPNDPYYANNWGHNNTAQLPAYTGGSHSGAGVGLVGFDSDAQLAWDQSQGYGSSGVVIAIIDSGFDLTHPDLLFVSGWDYGDHDASPSPELTIDNDLKYVAAHGMCCAGIAAAIANNGIGVAGLAGGCSIMPLKAMNSAFQTTWTPLTNCIMHAAQNGADVISMSIGFNEVEGSSPPTDAALEYAYSHNIPIIGTTGNTGTNPPGVGVYYPGNHNKVIAVGAASPSGERKSYTTPDGENWWASRYGSSVQDAQDAVDIMGPTILPTTDIQGSTGATSQDYYLWFSGTSCATPYVAGIVALLLSAHPDLEPDEVRTILTSTATDMAIGESQPGWDMYTGYGMVNANAALNYFYNIWDGSASSDWNDASNWSWNIVPTADQDVIIPATAFVFPIIASNVSCHDLTIEAGASVTVTAPGSLTVNNALSLHGALWISSANCTVHGELTTFSTCILTMNNCIFTNDAPTGAPPINNTVTLQGVVSLVNSQLWVSPKSLTLATDPSSVFTDSNITVAGNFIAIDANCFHPTGVNLFLSTGIESGLNVSNGNWVNNLYIFKEDPSGIVHLNANLAITGDFALMTGRFHTHGYGIMVAGNWTNNASPDHFVYSTGTVTFNGSTQQDISGNNWFYHVFCQNTLNTVQFWGPLSVMGNLTVSLTAVYFRAAVYLNQALYLNGGAYVYSYAGTWVSSFHGGGFLGVLGGTFTIWDLADAGLYGSFWVQDGHLVVYQDPAQYLDLNGWLNIQNGIVDFYGGSSGYYIGYDTNATLNMDSGELNFKNQGVYVGGHGQACDFNISGGIIRVNGNWYERSGAFDPTGGTVEFTGSVSAEAVFETPGGWFWGLSVNKPATRDEGEPEFESCRDGSSRPITRNREMTFQACTVKGGFQVIAAYEVYLIGDMNCLNANSSSVSAGTILAVINNASFTNTGNLFVYGTLMVAAGSSLKMSLAMTLGVYDGGTLICVGNSSYPALITHNGTGYYGLSIESGGTIGAEYTVFEYMNGDGVYIKPGASVASEYPLNHCTFRNGSTYMFSCLLRIDNSQEFTITSAYFPTNAGAYTYNVNKTVDNGIVYFANWSGSYGGPSHEYDPNNHVYWQNSGIPPVMNLTISYTASTNRVHLNWTYPLAATSYNIYRGLTPDGTFTLVDITSANTWSEVLPGDIYFYRVTAVMP